MNAFIGPLDQFMVTRDLGIILIGPSTDSKIKDRIDRPNNSRDVLSLTRNGPGNGPDPFLVNSIIYSIT